jgi:NitT/TauT family transport system substrate-binding protein
MPMKHSRRRFLTTLSMAAAMGLLRRSPALAAEGALETTTVRLPELESICITPQDVAEEMLRAEGFTDIRYVPLPAGMNAPEGIARGKIDFGSNFAPVLLSALDHGIPITVPAAVDPSCAQRKFLCPSGDTPPDAAHCRVR